jgi:hypothetical protein
VYHHDHFDPVTFTARARRGRLSALCDVSGHADAEEVPDGLVEHRLCRDAESIPARTAANGTPADRRLTPRRFF